MAEKKQQATSKPREIDYSWIADLTGGRETRLQERPEKGKGGKR